VRPGLTAPGSLFNYTHGDRLIGSEDPERDYREHVLSLKLASDLVYIRTASVRYDLEVIARTMWMLFCYALGRREFPEPCETTRARRLLTLLTRRARGSNASAADSTNHEDIEVGARAWRQRR
jgi:hypothetical protein